MQPKSCSFFEMAKIYKVVGIEGKGLGCIASKGQKISEENFSFFDSLTKTMKKTL
jgi:hypothetical protein